MEYLKVQLYLAQCILLGVESQIKAERDNLEEGTEDERSYELGNTLRNIERACAAIIDAAEDL